MGLINSIIDEVDNFAWRFVSSLKGSALDYCDLDTPLNETTFVTDKTELVSYIEIVGCYSLSGDQEFINASESLELLLNGLLENPRHSLQWVFNRHQSKTEDDINRLLKPLAASAQLQGFNREVVDCILKERLETVKRYVVSESCILAFKTYQQALSNIEKVDERTLKHKDALKIRLEKEKIPLKLGDFAQSPFVKCERLQTLHEASLQTLMTKLQSKEIGLVIRLLNTHESIKILRLMIDPDKTSLQWRASLPGDPVPYSDRSIMKNIKDNEYYPSISAQIFKDTITRLGLVIQYGETFCASVTVDLPSQKPKRFDELFKALPSSVDWRLSIHLIGGDRYFAGKIKTRLSFAKIFKVTNTAQNEPIIHACEHLLKIREEGEKLCGLRINLTIKSHSRESALKKINQCASILQAWGNLDTRFEQGDPWDTFVSGLPGLDTKNTGKTLITPLRETTIILPITRPMSPWHETGTNLWRTLDGKLFPYQDGSSLQHTWITLIYAPPGGGKSVGLNLQNFNLCLTPGLSRLPKISILDIGPSSQGLIELLKGLLPHERQYEAVHKTLKNDKNYAINPFDTPLGFRFPHNSKREFINNFLLILFTEQGQKTIRAGIGELVPDLVKTLYRHFSDEGNPKIYTRHVEPQIDDLLHQRPEIFSDAQRTQRGQLSWWSIVDSLCAHEYFHEAALAQRNAVPLISDLTSILHSSQQIKDIHGVTQGDEETFAHINKMIRSAITQYPILAYPTKFNVGSARVVALDLADVIGGSDEYSLKRAGLMYMLGRQILGGDYYFSEEDLKEYAGPAKPYHEHRLNHERGEIKRLCYDEFHRTSALSHIRHQVIQDMREARKFKIDLVLVSQIDTDFDEAMIELATNIYIYRGPEGTALDRVCKKFELNDSARHALKYHIRGAGKEGASFMFKCQTKTGNFVQALMNSEGPTLLWALTSTAEDALLRNRLIAHMPYMDALRLLVKKFPDSTCKKFVDEKIKTEEKTTEDIVEELIKELVNEYRGVKQNENA